MTEDPGETRQQEPAREVLTPLDPAPGTLVGRYEILSRIGAGGLGKVYRGRDPLLNRHVAIKIMRVPVRNDPTLARRFEQEARAAATLNHPNIVGVHDFGIHDGEPYIVAELIEGTSLRELIGNPLPIQKVTDTR
jgi:serine/threonine-protein kinase